MSKKNEAVSHLLKQICGANVSTFDDLFLYIIFEKIKTDTDSTSDNNYCNLLEESNKEGAWFLNSMHNCYNEFFRISLTFSVLEQVIIPSLLIKKKEAKEKEIRIWSAASSSGFGQA